MQTGAVIIAAGISARSGECYPMQNIGAITIAQRVAATLQQAGIGRIVMVIGSNAAALERQLSNRGIIFLRSDCCDPNQLSQLAGTGLRYLQNKCDQVLLAPVDIPFFTASTVSALLATSAPLVCPVCRGQLGYPVLLSSGLIPAFLDLPGCAAVLDTVRQLPSELTVVPVEDLGIFLDPDTMEDYDALLQIHNRQLIRPQVSVALAREVPFFDRKTATLLELIDETASVRTACHLMQISYSSGWNMIRTLETQLTRSLIVRSQGGANGSQSALTPYGRELLARYRLFLQEVRQNVDTLYRRYFDDLF